MMRNLYYRYNLQLTEFIYTDSVLSIKTEIESNNKLIYLSYKG